MIRLESCPELNAESGPPAFAGDHPRAAERRNLAVACLHRPWLIATVTGYGFGMIGRYTMNRVRRVSNRDVHGRGKQRPDWLGDCGHVLGSSVSGELVFPVYHTAVMPAARPTPSRIEADDALGDPESYLARHRWLQCVRALTADEEDVACAVESCVAWIRRSLPRSDAAWEPYSAAERIANLLRLLSARPVARRHIESQTLRRFLEDSLQWIDAHLEYYGRVWTNNHILNDARALVMAGVVLRNDQAVEKGLLVLMRMGPELFQPGGFLRERSAHYQVIVTNWLLDAVHFARTASPHTSPARENLHAMEVLAANAARATSRLLGHLGHGDTFIGDLSPDSPPELSCDTIQRLYPQWIQPHATTSSERIDDWVFLSSGGDRVMACTLAGKFPLGFPTHGHADLVHFTWHRDGVCVLADAGRSRYTGDVQSQEQVDARGHNVLMINGLGPMAESLIRGRPCYPTPYAAATIETVVNPSEPSVTVSHDGFVRVRQVGKHTRKVQITDRGLVVQDQVGGRGEVTLATLWHFAPGFSPTTIGGAPAVTKAGLVVSCGGELLGGGRPDARWALYRHSAKYGAAASAPMLRLTWTTSLPCTVVTTLEAAPCAE